MNTKTAHTPGPWNLAAIRDIVYSAGEWESVPDEEREANARLIAAAPDLLDLLEQALPYVEDGEQFNKPSRRGLSKMIRAAIAKVTGA